MLCPKCKSYNPSDATECSCGYDFELKAMRSTAIPGDTRIAIGSPGTSTRIKAPIKNPVLANYRSAVFVLYFIGIINILLGILNYASIHSVTSGIVLVIIGLIFLASGFCVHRKLAVALAALIICLVIYSLDALLLLISTFVNGVYIQVISLFIHACFIFVLANGIVATRKMILEKKAMSKGGQRFGGNHLDDQNPTI